MRAFALTAECWPRVDVRHWGTTPAEERLAFPCDGLLPGAHDAYRALTVDAAAPVLFRWLCQLRVAPYSYDWIDNLGRPSPRHLIPGLDDLAAGQRVMGLFELVEFERDVHLTVRSRPSRSFGSFAATYRIVPLGERRCRLVVKLLMAYPRPVLLARALGELVLLGDWVMMRKQLLTLKRLAEETERR